VSCLDEEVDAILPGKLPAEKVALRLMHEHRKLRQYPILWYVNFDSLERL